MKRHFYFFKALALTALLAMNLISNAQTITIGEESILSGQVPIYTMYTYSLTEQIYRADEIDYSGNIKAISFRIGYDYSTPDTVHIDVYMKHVSKNMFPSPDDYETVTAEDLVYSGPWTIPAFTDNWITIELDTLFQYNGTDNLMVAIDAICEQFAIRFFKTSSVSSSVFSCYSDTEKPDPSDLLSFGGLKDVVHSRANIKLVFDPNVEVGENSSITLSVYPNPTNDILYIDGLDHEMVSVYDATGHLVMQEIYDGKLDISHLSSGVYAITSDKGTKKIMKK